MKAARLYIESQLPEDLRDPERTYTAKEIGNLLSDVAVRYPDEFERISRMIGDLGRNASYWQGETIGLKDMIPIVDREPVLRSMQQELDQLSPRDPDYSRKKNEIWTRYNEQILDMVKEQGRSSDNAIAQAVLSGARGKDLQLKMINVAPGLFQDHFGKTVPLFVRHSYAEGLSPAEVMASTYGARSSVVSTKRATAAGGDALKQATNTAITQVITEEDCTTDNGLDMDVTDRSLKGRVLARPVAGLEAGTVLDRASIRKLEKEGVDRVVARSPMTCQSAKGLCSRCLGKFYDQKFAPIGTSVGVTASQAIFEPVVQGALGCLREGTLVRMADLSTKAIEKIQVGDRVLGSDMQGHTFPVKVLKKWDQGIQDVYRWKFRQGQTSLFREMDATEDHKMLLIKRVYAASYWTEEKPNYDHPLNRKAQRLPVGVQGQDVSAVLPLTVPDMGEDQDMALLCGCLLGDGIRNDGKTTHRFSCADPELVTDLNTHLEPYGLRLKKLKRSYDYGIMSPETTGWSNRDPKTGRMLPGTKHPLRLKMREWDMVGKYAHEKTLPPGCLTQWSRKSLGELIAGYIATDGAVTRNKNGHIWIQFGSTSKMMLDQLKEVLELRFGVYTGMVRRGGRAGEGNRKHDMWSIGVTRLDQVRTLVGQLPRIPGVKGERLERYLEEVQYQERNPDTWYLCKRQKKPEYLGRLHCWDLSVDHEDELFVLANGLVVKNSKHTSGAASAKKDFSGFDVLNQFLQSPSHYPGRTALAETEGQVTSIRPADQGGHYVQVGDREHYVPQGFEVLVKEGDQVEAGQPLSDGLSDVRDVVRLRGLGSGRRYMASRMGKILEDSGLKADPRNLEILSRAMVNHVEIEDDEGLPGRLSGDMVDYNRIQREFVPPADTKRLPTPNALGKYLQKPALHYSVGTRLTGKQLERLQKAGYNEVYASSEPPPFIPVVQRLRTSNRNQDDWLGRQFGSYLKDNLQDASVRGLDTNVQNNIHFGPRLALGKDFGKNTSNTGEF